MSLHEKLAFDEPTSTDDDFGGKESGWTEIHTCRGSVRYLRGGEVVQAARLEGRQPVVLKIRKCASALVIGPAYRARDVVLGLDYNIKSGGVETKDRKYLEFTAESGVAI